MHSLCQHFLPIQISKRMSVPIFALNSMALNDPTHEYRDVYESLRTVGCCKRCCLRYLGERDSDAYRNVDEWVEKKGFESGRESNNGPNSKVPKHNPCIACLGLLQGSVETTVNKISTDVLAASYDCDIFTCAVSLPISFQLRAHSLWIYLMDKFPVPFSLPELQQESHVTSVKEVWKWTIAPLVSKTIGKEFDSGLKSDFFVGVNVSYAEDEKECACLLLMHEHVFKERRSQRRKYHGHLFTRKSVDVALQTTDSEHFKKYFPSPPTVPSSMVCCDQVTCSHNSIYMAGCYNKFSRMLSQTPWVIEGERKMTSSVQEIICESLQTASRAESSKFLSSGREDVDVRMLGRGRPFACELINPHKVKFSKEEIRTLETGINASSQDVTIRDLQVIPKEQLVHLKAGEEEKRKRYLALCVSREPLPPGELDQLADITDLILCQKTPIRVLHRRPLAIRNRTIYSMKAWPVGDDPGGKGYLLFKLDITTQAGTYIKEFVHGDFGRTKPSLGDLLGGASVDIVALDVEEIYLDWPPPVCYSPSPE